MVLSLSESALSMLRTDSREAPSLRGVLSGERGGGSRGAVDREKETLGPAEKRHCRKRLRPQRKAQGTGICSYPGDVGDEAAGPLLVAADLQGLDVVRRAVAGSIDCRHGLAEGEGNASSEPSHSISRMQSPR